MAAPKVGKEVKIDMAEFPPERIRNFSVIAHIDVRLGSLSGGQDRADGEREGEEVSSS